MRPLFIAVLAAIIVPAVAESFDVVLLRPSGYLSEHPRAGSEVHKYMQSARDILEVAGLRHHTIDEQEALSNGLPSGEFLLCPYNPNMSADVAAAIRSFLDGGGHALFCYFCEDSLRERLGIGDLLYTPGGEADLFRYLEPTCFAPPGAPDRVEHRSWNAFLLASIDEHRAKPVMEWIAADGKTNYGPALVMSGEAAWFGHVMTPGELPGKAQMLLSVIGRWEPEVWDRAVEWVLRPDLGFRYAPDVIGLQELARGRASEARARELANAFETLRNGAGKRPAWEVFEEAVELRSGVEGAYLAALPTRDDKLRGAWVVSPRGVGDWGWEKTARVASENGLTDLFVRVGWGGRANYKSKVLPMRISEDEDPVAEGIAACHKHGLKYHAWFINFNWRTPTAAIIEDISAKGLWQIAPDGEERIQEGRDRVYWLNPSEPGVVELQAAMMAEVAREYAVDGVHFDYIRYENYSGSYGERDRQRFEAWASVKSDDWPDDVLRARGDKPAGKLHEQFCEWRCEQVSQVVRAVAEAVRAVRPTCQLSAAVYPSWPYHRKSVAQDWARWLNEGWIDFVCPMTYDTPGRFERHTDRVRRQREAAGDKPLMVGIGSWLHPGPVSVAECIVADRELGADGFLLFSYTPALGEHILPALRDGLFAEP